MAGGHRVVLGRGDVVLAEADDGCEKVKRPRGEPTPVFDVRDCDDPHPCAVRVAPGRYPTEGACTATYDSCEDPFAEEPEPDEPVDMPAPEEL